MTNALLPLSCLSITVRVHERDETSAMEPIKYNAPSTIPPTLRLMQKQHLFSFGTRSQRVMIDLLVKIRT